MKTISMLGLIAVGALIVIGPHLGASEMDDRSESSFSTLNAGWLERFGLANKTATNQPSEIIATTLSQDQMIGGLREALGKGVEQAVASLGKEDGFLQDLSVKIPMPAPLKKVESSLRIVRQDQLADEFVATMNRAAEQAVPEAAAVLAQSVEQMTVTDVKAILTGTNNAATQYFRRTSETNLYDRFLPIVKAATEKTGVTSAYKRMTSKAGGGVGGLATFGGSLLGKEAPDLDSYVTQKTLDGLFVKIAEQEKRIRENPAARTTELLQQVFGAFQK